MKVLQVVPGLAVRAGGPGVAAVEGALALRRQGVESAILAPDLPGPPSARAQRPVRPDELPPGAESLDVRLFPVVQPYRLARSPQLARALDEAVPAYDVVHIHSLFLHPQHAAFRAARRHGVPHVVSLHGMLDPYLRRRGRVRKALVDALWQRRMLETAAALVAGAEEEARLSADVAPLVPHVVVPNAVRTDAFAQLPDGSAFRERHLGGFDGPVVLFLGRVTPKKGVDVLVRALARANGSARDARLVVAGPDDGGLVARLRDLAEREGVGERVSFPGALYGQEKLAALAACDVFALASRSEGAAVAVVEALAAGRPVLVSTAVNIAPELAAGDAGVLCEPEPGPVAAALAALLGDAALRRRLAENARAVARRYDAGAVGPQLVDLYERAARP